MKDTFKKKSCASTQYSNPDRGDFWALSERTQHLKPQRYLEKQYRINCQKRSFKQVHRNYLIHLTEKHF